VHVSRVLHVSAHGKTLHVRPAYDASVITEIQERFEENYTILFANYPLDERYWAHGATVVGCGS